jgi:hypothetical protein
MNIYMFSQVKYASHEENGFLQDLTVSIQLKGDQNLQNSIWFILGLNLGLHGYNL